ncbi:heterokaryon incompatibility protein-domain-containing protein, partial [Podospora appendiculata]
MRLVNVDTLELEFFEGGPKAAFAILSHTWGEEEVSFQDMTTPGAAAATKKGFAKIVGCCAKARSEGYRHVWIDTCCIDKSSSAELSEAINSMFKWYQEAEVCYAFLSDVVVVAAAPTVLSLEQQLRRVGLHMTTDEMIQESRWFTRGWTLQELLAPSEVVFLDKEWRELGTRESLCVDISEITGVDVEVLKMERSWADLSVAQRLSWAAGRHTSRVEDEAYCLMGLFGVNMPLLYGEGRKAFQRLQLEIMKQSSDSSILAWASPDSHSVIEGVLAQSPAMFEDCGDIEWCPLDRRVGRVKSKGSFVNNIACYDIIGYSLRMEVGMLEPPPAGGASMVFQAFQDAPEATTPVSHVAADLIYFPRNLEESYTQDKAFREFDYSFLQHSRAVALILLDGCMKEHEYIVGIALCLDSKGLMKRVHFPSRFLVAASNKSVALFDGQVKTLHIALTGSEVLQRPPIPNWARCLVRVPNMADLPYELAYTIPEKAHDAAGCWYLERWSEATDLASLDPQPCFSLHKTGTGRAMVFNHKKDPSLSFLVVFSLVK